MSKLMAAVMAVSMSACMYFDPEGDDVAVTPDAAPVVAVDATAPADCHVGLPSCASLACAVGAVTPDCPRPDDMSAPCYCPAIDNPGWCVRP